MPDRPLVFVNRLTKSGFLPSMEWKVRKDVSVSENGKTYTVKLNPAKRSAVYQIDGEIIRDGRKCDKLVVVCGMQEDCTVFVELKGKNITHAIDQLDTTLNHMYFQKVHEEVKVIRARIVTGGSGPASYSNKVMTDAKTRFLK